MSSGSASSAPAREPSATKPAHRRLPPIGRAVAVLLLAGVVALLIYGVTAQSPNTSIDDSLARGQTPPAPAFTLAILQPGRLGPTLTESIRRALADGRLSTQELRGHRVVLNVWASWCDPCRQEAPLLERTWRAARTQRVLFVGLDMQDLTTDATGFLRQYQIDYLNIRDPGNSVAQRYGSTGLPETFFISPSGRIVGHVIGVSTAADLRAGIAATATGRPLGARQAGASAPIR